MHHICLYLNIRNDCLIQIAQIHFKYNQLISNAEKTYNLKLETFPAF